MPERYVCGRPREAHYTLRKKTLNKQTNKQTILIELCTLLGLDGGDEPHFDIIKYDQQSRQRKLLSRFGQKTLRWFSVGHLQTDFFKSWCDDSHQWTLQLSATLNDPTFNQDNNCVRK